MIHLCNTFICHTWQCTYCHSHGSLLYWRLIIWEWRDIYNEKVKIVSLMPGLKTEGIIYCRGSYRVHYWATVTFSCVGGVWISQVMPHCGSCRDNNSLHCPHTYGLCIYSCIACHSRCYIQSAVSWRSETRIMAHRVDKPDLRQRHQRTQRLLLGWHGQRGEVQTEDSCSLRTMTACSKEPFQYSTDLLRHYRASHVLPVTTTQDVPAHTMCAVILNENKTDGRTPAPMAESWINTRPHWNQRCWNVSWSVSYRC